METGTERARANDEPPDLSKSTELLFELLAIEKARLEIAVKIEKKRDIVFPETTVIIHDIVKLQNEIDKRRQVKNKINGNLFDGLEIPEIELD